MGRSARGGGEILRSWLRRLRAAALGGGAGAEVAAAAVATASAAAAPVLTPQQEARNMAVLWTGCFLTSASWSLVLPFMPIMLAHLGVRSANLATWTGIVFASAFATAIFFSPMWGAWADAVGRKVNMLRSGVTITIVFLGLANAHSPWMVLFWRLLNGAFSGFIPAAFSLVAVTTDSRRLGRALGTLQAAPAAGNILGPLLGGGLVQLVGIQPTFYLAAAAQAVATVLVLTVVREPVPPRRGMRLDLFGGLGEAFRNRELRAVLGATVVLQLALTIIEPLITIYVAGFPGVTAVPFLAGLLFSLVGLAAVLCSQPWGRAGERIGYVRIAAVGLLGAAVGNAAQLFCHTLVAFGAVRLASGVAYAGANTGLATLAATSVPESFRGRAYGLLTSSQQMGNLFGPLLGGFWGDAYGLHSAFGVASIAFVLALVVLLSGRGRPRTVAAAAGVR